jgi:hypothetical protein
MATTRCYQIHGGSCKNLVSVKGGYICSVGHGDNQVNNFQREVTIPSLNDLEAERSLDDKLMEAKDPLTPPDTLIHLSKDPDENVRFWVAGNRSTPLEALYALSEDKSSIVCQTVGWNPYTPLDLYVKLAKKGVPPYGFATNKHVDRLLGTIHFIDESPLVWGDVYLHRLTKRPKDTDATHPKTKLLIGYSFTKFAEASNNQYLISEYREKIQSLYPDDLELAEMVGY